jgi:AbrB family looped-hinge helix DNA binding protein
MDIYNTEWHNISEMSENETLQVTLGRQGRLVVPAPLRRRLGIQAGDVLVARAEDDRLVLERPEAVVARLQRRFAKIPPEVSLVDELLAERRAEAKRERRG